MDDEGIYISPDELIEWRGFSSLRWTVDNDEYIVPMIAITHMFTFPTEAEREADQIETYSYTLVQL